MSLNGKTNEEKIWNYLKSKLNNEYGAAGIAGNIQAESGFIPNNMQNSYEKKLGFTDETYTKAVDDGTYTNFIEDRVGWGLVQWTHPSLKKDFYNYVKSKGVSIGDLETQLEFLCKQLSEDFVAVWNACKNATNVKDASNAMLLKFERPADQSEAVQNKRAGYGEAIYAKYATKTTAPATTDLIYKVGDIVDYTGTTHYASSNSTNAVACKAGVAKVTALAKGAKHPYHLIRESNGGSTVYGWVDAEMILGLYKTESVKDPITNGETRMKYNSNNKPLQCMMTQSTCYKQTRTMTVKGVLWHSTGANNPNLRRYVQPDDNASNRAELLAKLGTNTNKNDWNHIYHEAGLNCWIGKLADGTVTTVQTMPWDYRPWGCGSGSKGSCNDGWIQFEICEDGLTDRNYFEKVYKEACELTAYLCKMFNINPHGTVMHNGVKVPTILCHIDSNSYGLGSNHGDVLHWFPKFGKNMNNVRDDVAALLEGSSSSTGNSSGGSNSGIVVPTTPSTNSIKAGSIVKISSDATYYGGQAMPAWVKNKNWIVLSISGDRAVIDKSQDGSNSIMSPVNVKYLTDISGSSNSGSTEPSFIPYKVKVTASVLNIRKGAGTNYAIAGSIKDNGVYTIISESNGTGATKWGLLKSKAGWISLDYVKKV